MAIEKITSMIDKFSNRGKKNSKPSDEEEVVVSKKAKIEREKAIEDILPYEDFYEDYMKIEDGKYRAIVKTNAIQVEGLDDLERDNILDMFGTFLDSNINPIQIYIPSYKMDMSTEIERLKRIKAEKILEQDKSWLDDEMEFQQETAEEHDIVETLFYIVFQAEFKPSGNERKDFLKAKKDLSKQIKFANDQLLPMGMKISKLSKNETGEVLYNYFNPFSRGLQKPDFEDCQVIYLDEEKKKNKKKRSFLKKDKKSEEVVFQMEKGETDHLQLGGLSFKEKITPYSLNDFENPEYIKAGPAKISVYEIYDYPKKPGHLWAKRLYKYRENIDISIHVKPIPTDEVMVELENASKKYGSATVDLKTGEKRKGKTRIDKTMEKSENEADMMMDVLDDGEESFFHFSMYVSCKARTLEELEDLELEVEKVLGSMRVLFRKTTDNMRNAIMSVAPFGLNKLGTTRNMFTSGVANAFPFTNHTYNKEDGMWLGINKSNYSYVRVNEKVLENQNLAVLGTSGGGKSVTTKKIVKNLLMTRKAGLWAVDPEGEMCVKREDKETTYAEDIGAEVLKIYAGSKHKINIMEIMYDEDVDSLVKNHISFLKIFFKERIEGITPDEMKIISSALIHLYREFGFTDNKDTYFDDSNKGDFSYERKKRKPPELIDFYNLLESNKLEEELGDTKKLAAKILDWTRKGTNDIFDGQTNIDFQHTTRIIFNLRGLDTYLKDSVVFVIMNMLWGLSRSMKELFKIVYIEEAHYLMRNDEMAEYLYDMSKRIRKYNGMIAVVTQQIADFMKSQWGPEILDNCSWVILMKQKKTNIKALKEAFEMFDSEAIKMTKFDHTKGECYLFIENFRIHMNIMVSEKELDSFRTS